MRHLELVSGAFFDDLREPLVEWQVRKQALQRLENFSGARLQKIDLEALVVKPVNAVFHAPVIFCLGQ